jgi:hypothetical protein
MGAIFSLAGMGTQELANQEEHAQKISELQQNETLAKRAAGDALLRGNQQAGRTRVKGTQLIGQQDVAYANSGVDPTQGSAAQTMANTSALTELDAQTQQNNAAREAWGFGKVADKYNRMQGYENTNYTYKQIGTFLNGVGSMFGGSGFGMSLGGGGGGGGGGTAGQVDSSGYTSSVANQGAGFDFGGF